MTDDGRRTPGMTTVADQRREQFRQQLLDAVYRFRRSQPGPSPLPVSPTAFYRACRSYKNGRPTMPSEYLVGSVVAWMGGDVRCWVTRRADIEDLEYLADPDADHLAPWPPQELIDRPPIG